MHIGEGPWQDGVNHRDKVHGSTHRALDWSLKQRQEATVIRLSAESPRYIMQQAMYLPWRGVTLHHHRGWFEHGHAFSAEMTGA